MTAHSEQTKSSRRTVWPFEIKARRRGAVQEEEVARRHHSFHDGGSAPRSPRNRRSRSPLRRTHHRREDAASEFERSKSQEEPPVGEQGKQPDEESEQEAPPQDARSAWHSEDHVPGKTYFELESQVEVTKMVLKDVEGRVAELSAASSAVDEQVGTVEKALEVSKERKAAFHQRMQAAVQAAKLELGNAQSAVDGAEATIEALVKDVERDAATIATQTKAAKDATADAQARISALEAAPGLAEREGSAPGSAAAEAAKEAAEAHRAAMKEKLAGMKEDSAKALASLASQGGQLGELAGRVVELEAKLSAQRSDAAKLQQRAKELGVDQAAAAHAAKEPAAAVPVRRPPRLFAMSPGLLEAAGEYKLLPEGVSGRPAYAHKGAGGAAIYLFWANAGGRCSWVLAKELPAAENTDAELSGLLARSVQATWTALPDELASPHWDTGSATVDITLLSAGA